MRLVIATLLAGQVEAVRHALADVHVTRLSIADAHGYPMAGPMGASTGAVAQLAVMEIAVNDDFLERTVATIAGVMNLAGRGQDTSGGTTATGLYVLPISETVQIYRAVRGPEAI